MHETSRRAMLRGLAGASVVLTTGCGGGGGSAPAPTSGGGGPLAPPVSVPRPVQVPTRPEYDPQTAFAPSAPFDVGVEIDWYVDAETGDDGAAGDEASPLRSLDRARSLAAPDDVIGLKRGQTHFRDLVPALPDTVSQSVVGYGDSIEPATISGGQSLSGAIWVFEGSGVYRTQISIPRAHLPGGSGLGSANTTYPFVRGDAEDFRWIVGQPSIAQNLAVLAGTRDGAFCINAAGSDIPDIRDEAAGAVVFDLYVRLPDGIDPAGAPLITMAHKSAHKWGSLLLQDLRIRDAWGKDTTGTAARQPNIPMLRRIETLGGGSHGWVGTCQIDGFRAVGLPRPGMFGADRGRAAGSGLNLFSQIDRVDGYEMRGIDIEGFQNAVYGHASSTSSRIARRFDFLAAEQEGFADFRVRNCSAAIKFDPKNGLPVVPGGIRVECAVDLVDIDVVMATESTAIIAGPGVAIFSTNTPQTQQISQLRTKDADHRYNNIIFYSPRTLTDLFYLEMVRIGNADLGGVPSISFASCELPVHPDYAFRVGIRSDADAVINLAISGTSQMGDPISPFTRRYPVSFTASGRSAFAMDDRETREQVRGFLNSVGTANTIADSTTVLRSDGRVSDEPV